MQHQNSENAHSFDIKMISKEKYVASEHSVTPQEGKLWMFRDILGIVVA